MIKIKKTSRRSKMIALYKPLAKFKALAKSLLSGEVGVGELIAM
jgi:hypothetical protein